MPDLSASKRVAASTRGEIKNRFYATRIRDFRGLRFKNITPTDIDAFIEYRGLGFVFIESKYGSAPLPFGQKLALERLVDECQKPALLIVGSHTNSGDIDFAALSVEQFRFQGKWFTEEQETTVGALVLRFLNFLDAKKI